jgi:hypothetical protein
VWGMNRLGTPQASFIVAIPILIASFILARRWERVIPVLLAATAVLMSPLAANWLTLPREEPAPIIFTHWDAMSKIKVYDYGTEARGINIDNVANSPVYHFAGDWSAINPDSTEWGIDVSYLIRRFPRCTFLSLGAGGGGDVFQATG